MVRRLTTSWEKAGYNNLFIKSIVILAMAGFILIFSSSGLLGQSYELSGNQQLVKNDIQLVKTNLNNDDKKSSEVLGKFISLNLNEVSLESALKTVVEKANLKLSFSENVLPTSKKVSLVAESITVNKAIWQLLSDTDTRYAISPNGFLVIMRWNDRIIPKENVQTGTITGQVMDASTDESLAGANVFIEELSTGAATDANGEFTIEDVETGTYNIEASFIGFKTSTKNITVEEGENIVNFNLQADVSGLEDVVVTGIASRTSKSVSEVSVSSINAEELTKGQSYSGLTGLLSGKAAGVNISKASGSVGSGMRFKMRSGGGLKGTGQPVIYIDGIRVDNSEVEGLGAGGQGFGTLADLNPDEIESIDILKGPAASALYGTSGSNGVVLITTKSGRNIQGDGIEVGIKTTLGYNEQKTPYSKHEFLTADGANAEFRKGAIEESAINLSGSSGIVRYHTSIGRRYEEGLLRGNNMKRTSLRANFDAYPTEDLTISVSTGYTNNNNSRQLLDNAFGPLNNTIFITDQQLWSKTGSREAVYAWEDILKTNRFISSLNLSWSPLENFEIQAAVGHDESDMREDQTQPYGYSYGGDDDGAREIFERKNQQQTYDFNARYSYQVLPDLEITSIVGTQIFNRLVTTLNIDKENFPAQGITNIGAGEEFLGADETRLHTRSAGIFMSHQFNYEDTYYATIGGRRDYASSVGADAPNIFYPKASASVRVDKFNILPSVMNFLKLRAAYGESGQLPNVYDGASRLWGASNYGYGAGAALDIIGNPEIKPERVKELEFGVETEFFENIGLDLTYYRQSAEESIVEYQQSPSTGLTADNLPFNVGQVSGSGLEADINATALRTESSALNLKLIWNYSENEVTELGQAQPIFDWNNVVKKGLPRSAFYAYENNGALFNENGTYAGADLSFSNRVFVGTPYPKHNGSFSIDFRFLNDFNLRVLNEWALDLYVHNATALIAERYGNYAKRLRLGARINDDRFREVWEEEFPDIQQVEPGTEAYKEAANKYALLNPRSGYGYVQRADWFKVRELTLTYNMMSLMQQIGASELFREFDVSFSATNLYNYSLYEGPDPEVHWQGARTIGQGRDFTSLQHPRTYNLSVNIGF